MSNKLWIDFLNEKQRIMIKSIFRNDKKIPNLERIYIDKIVITEFSIDLYLYFPMPLQPIKKMIQKGCNILYGNFNIVGLKEIEILKENFLHNGLETYSINIIEENNNLEFTINSNYNSSLFFKCNNIELLNFGCTSVEESFLSQLPSNYQMSCPTI